MTPLNLSGKRLDKKIALIFSENCVYFRKDQLIVFFHEGQSNSSPVLQPTATLGIFFRKTNKCDILWSIYYINLKQMKEKNYLQVAERKMVN